MTLEVPAKAPEVPEEETVHEEVAVVAKVMKTASKHEAEVHVAEGRPARHLLHAPAVVSPTCIQLFERYGTRKRSCCISTVV